VVTVELVDLVEMAEMAEMVMEGEAEDSLFIKQTFGTLTLETPEVGAGAAAAVAGRLISSQLYLEETEALR
jgi:hypothetical protein